AAEQPAEAVEQQQLAEAAKRPDGTPHWLKDHWHTLPAEVQKLIRENWGQVEQAYHGRWGPFDVLLQAYKQEFDEARQPPHMARGQLLYWHRLLRQDPQHWLCQLARQFGLDPAKPLYDDAVRSREPRWGQYLQQVQTQAQQAQTLNAVEAWGSNKSHF